MIPNRVGSDDMANEEVRVRVRVRGEALGLGEVAATKNNDSSVVKKVVATTLPRVVMAKLQMHEVDVQGEGVKEAVTATTLAPNASMHLTTSHQGHHHHHCKNHHVLAPNRQCNSSPILYQEDPSVPRRVLPL